MTNSCLTCYISPSQSQNTQVNMSSCALFMKMCRLFRSSNCSCHYFSGKDRFWCFRPCWQILLPNTSTNPPPLICWLFSTFILRIPTKQKRHLNILLPTGIFKTFPFFIDIFNFQSLSNPSESSWFQIRKILKKGC